jgi:hypothetical protein
LRRLLFFLEGTAKTTEELLLEADFTGVAEN